MHETFLPNWRQVESLRFPSTHHSSSQEAVVIVGAGPVGLTLAIDLAQRGIPSVVLSNRDKLSEGSRAICWSRRTLEIFDRIGIAATMREHGAQWDIGRIFYRDKQIYHMRLTPENSPQNPFFVNFQQSLCEYLLVEACHKYSSIDLRWMNTLVDYAENSDHSFELKVETSKGQYDIQAQYLLACDGAHSFVRKKKNLFFEGKTFNDRFLIVDIEMDGDFPAERRFWFEPPFHEGQSTLLHKQAQNVWRIDFQLDSEPSITKEKFALELDETAVKKRIKAFLGQDNIDFSIVWNSVYAFTCRRLERFRHGNIFFVGDSAHVVSPFGARGGNGGIQDADNLAWKLAYVLQKKSDPSILDTYEEERIPASDENIKNSSRTTDFMTPKSKKSKQIRDVVLRLSQQHDFAIRLVNAGRMSLPFSYAGLSLCQQKTSKGTVQPGDAVLDLPLLDAKKEKTHLLKQITALTLLAYNCPLPANTESCIGILLYDKTDEQPSDSNKIFIDTEGYFSRTYFNAKPGERAGYVVFRPDQHVFGMYALNEDKQMRSDIKKLLNGETPR